MFQKKDTVNKRFFRNRQFLIFIFFLPLALLVDFSTLSLWHETREKQNIRAIQNSDGIGTKTHFSQTSKKESDNTHIKNGH